MSASLTTPSEALVIVAKYPEPGQVKTRLGAVIGDRRAAILYAAFLRDLAARFDAPGVLWEPHWACTPGKRPPEALRAIVGARAHVFPQRGKDFADRLYHICADMQALGARRLVIMSSDAPQIPVTLVAQAFATLAKTEIALSPAEDGGYSLIGLQLPAEPALPPDLFRGIRMSTATVRAETLARAESLGLRATLLDPAFDVDIATDLVRLWRTLYVAPTLAPRTYAALASLFNGTSTVTAPRIEDTCGDFASR